MMHERTDFERKDTHGNVRCISWAAIIVAALIALGLSFLLNLFEMAISLTAFKMNPDGRTVLAIGGFIGFAIGIIAIMFASGWIAGYLGRSYCYNKYLGALYGFTTWCVALVLLATLSIPFAHFVAMSSNVITNRANTLIQYPLQQAAPATQAQASAEKTANNNVLAVTNDATRSTIIGAFGLFILFLLGALASSFGGHFGMNPNERYRSDRD